MSSKESFEQNLKKLSQIVEALEDPDLALERSLKLFEDGIKYAQFCEKKLNEAEGKLEKLVAEYPQVKKESFEI